MFRMNKSGSKVTKKRGTIIDIQTSINPKLIGTTKQYIPIKETLSYRNLGPSLGFLTLL